MAERDTAAAAQAAVGRQKVAIGRQRAAVQLKIVIHFIITVMISIIKIGINPIINKITEIVLACM